jgi:hypothetical protein
MGDEDGFFRRLTAYHGKSLSFPYGNIKNLLKEEVSRLYARVRLKRGRPGKI